MTESMGRSAQMAFMWALLKLFAHAVPLESFRRVDSGFYQFLGLCSYGNQRPIPRDTEDTVIFPPEFDFFAFPACAKIP